MNKESFINLLKNICRQYKLSIEVSTLEKIVDISNFRVIKKGEVIRHIGDNTDSAGLVIDGITRSYYVDGNGNDITRGFSFEETLCMDEGLLGYNESLCEWETLEDTTIMIFNVAELKILISKCDDLKNAYILLLENSLRYKIYRENGFLVENATERYIHLKKLYPQICSRVAQHHMATYLGVAPESLSRIRKALKEND